MDRTDLQRLSKDELIELVIQLQRPVKSSRNSSKPPSTDKKEALLDFWWVKLGTRCRFRL